VPSQRRRREKASAQCQTCHEQSKSSSHPATTFTRSLTPTICFLSKCQNWEILSWIGICRNSINVCRLAVVLLSQQRTRLNIHTKHHDSVGNNRLPSSHQVSATPPTSYIHFNLNDALSSQHRSNPLSFSDHLPVFPSSAVSNYRQRRRTTTNDDERRRTTTNDDERQRTTTNDDDDKQQTNDATTTKPHLHLSTPQQYLQYTYTFTVISI